MTVWMFVRGFAAVGKTSVKELRPLWRRENVRDIRLSRLTCASGSLGAGFRSLILRQDSFWGASRELLIECGALKKKYKPVNPLNTRKFQSVRSECLSLSCKESGICSLVVWQSILAASAMALVLSYLK